MKKILVTGGAGQIGSELVKGLVKNTNNFVVILDNLLTGSSDNLPDTSHSNWQFHQIDVNNEAAIKEIMIENRFDYVFHYAAVVGVTRTLQNPLLVLSDIKGIENILKYSKETSVKRVFYSSSSEVYGEPVEIPQNEETTPLNSKLPYAIVKNVGEAYFRSFQREYGLDYTIFRFFNTYGPFQTDDFVVPRFIKLARNNEDITIYGDGLQTRTFCYIEDNINTVIKILEDDLFVNDVLNIGNDLEITILELAKTIIGILGSSSKIVHLDPLKEGDMARRQPDISKMKTVLGRDLITLENGIRRVIDN